MPGILHDCTICGWRQGAGDGAALVRGCPRCGSTTWSPVEDDVDGGAA